MLEIGDKAPNFKGVDEQGKEVKLSDYKGEKLILYFYPKDNTPGCTAESCNLNDNYQMWQAKGYEVLGVSPDSVESHKKFKTKYNLGFRLIADTDKKILEAYGAWGEKNMYGKIVIGVIRKTYVIDEEGVITQIFGRVKTKEHTEQILKKIGEK
ncbi:MAG: thioredoxin-dependent thiol peroxidase [Bacteroidales bacterium]